jgi:hypothetical protein
MAIEVGVELTAQLLGLGAPAARRMARPTKADKAAPGPAGPGRLPRPLAQPS